jgi:uracil-DNA glycosylase family 4
VPNYVPGCGPFEPKLMIIGEAPGKHEDEQMTPFVGPTGAMLDSYLNGAGISRSECFITNVVKYRPPFNDLKKLNLIGVDVDESIKDLWENEIKILKPNAILAVGDLALRATTNFSGILNYRGSILRAIDGRTKVIPTIHPAALFSRFSPGEDAKGGLDYVYHKFIQSDICRAVEESQSRELDLPARNLRVIRNSLELFRFFRDYEHLDKAASDIESVNCIPVCIGFAFNRSHAVSVPLLKNFGSIELTSMSMSELVECWRIVDAQLRRLRIVGHNFKYDEFKLNLCGFEIPNVVSDTLIKLRVIFPEMPEKKLSTAASLWTREPYYKDEGKEFKIGKSKIDQLFLYNAKDCAVEIEVDEETDKDLIGLQERFNVPLVDYYYNYMMKKHKFYLKMENVGFRVDIDKQRELRKRYTELEREVHAKLSELVGYDINVKSYPQMYQLLYKAMGFRPYKNNPTSEDSIVKLLGSHCKGKDGPKKQEILECILEERRIRDQKSRNIAFTLDYDDRCKTSFNIIATETCRSSTSVPKKPVRPKKLGLAFHTISKHGRLAKDIRSMFIPDEGKVFIQADSSQAEARVVAILSKDWDLLEAFDKIDIHRRTAGLVFGYSNHLILTHDRVKGIDDLEKDGPERFTGKKTRHAGNYNMGKRRFMTEFNTDAQKFGIPMTISEWKAGQMLDLFHAASPKIRGVFHQDIIDAIASTRTLIDPYGGVRVFNGRMDEDLFKEGFANIPQRTVSHLVQSAGLAVNDEIQDDKEACFISENHDALVMQVPENNWEVYAKLLKKHMEKPIDFNTYCTLKRDIRLVIPCDIEIGVKNYADMKKVKL